MMTNEKTVVRPQPFSLVDENCLTTPRRKKNDLPLPYDEKERNNNFALKQYGVGRSISARSRKASSINQQTVEQKNVLQKGKEKMRNKESNLDEEDAKFNKAIVELRDMLEKSHPRTYSFSDHKQEEKKAEKNEIQKQPQSTPRGILKRHESPVKYTNIPNESSQHRTRETSRQKDNEQSSPHSISSQSRSKSQEIEMLLDKKDIVANEEAATLKLRGAEKELKSMKQELEELRFFHEIDIEDLAPMTPTRVKASQQYLSPRRLSCMDRTTLELETQELQRKLEVMTQEKANATGIIKNFEKQAQVRSEEGTRIRSMEKTIEKVQSTMSTQVDTINQNRARLIEWFNSQLNEVTTKNIQLWKESGSLASEIIASKRTHQTEVENLSNLLECTQETLSATEIENKRLYEELEERNQELDAFKKDLADNLILLQDRDYEYKELERHHSENLMELDSKVQQVVMVEAKLENENRKVDELQRKIEDFVEKEEMNSLMCSW